MKMELALQKVARAWGTEKTSHKPMDVELATAFAEILIDEVTFRDEIICEQPSKWQPVAYYR